MVINALVPLRKSRSSVYGNFAWILNLKEQQGNIFNVVYVVISLILVWVLVTFAKSVLLSNVSK